MTNEEIKTLALACGFTERPQDNGRMDLNPYVYESHRKAYDMGFADGAKHSDWVSVDERLPDTNDWVLVYYEYYADYCDKWDKRVSFGFYDGKVWRDMEYSNDKNCYYELDCVKFWQPLPQPPSEVQP